MKVRLKRLNESGFDHVMVVVVFVVLFALIGTYLLIQSHAATSSYQLKMTLSSSSINTSLCLDNQGGGTGNGNPVISYGCNTNDGAQKWVLQSVSGGFQIKSASANVCVDDKGDAVGNGPSNRVPVVVWGCNAADHAQIWNWYGGSTYGMLKNHYNNGCINDTAGSKSAGTQLIVYPCTGSGPTYFAQSAVSSGGTTGGSGGGGSFCTSGTTNQKALCYAERFNNVWYLYGGGHVAASTFEKNCPDPAKGANNTSSACRVDCSGLVTQAIDYATKKNYQWSAGSGAMIGSAGWHRVTDLSKVLPGDIAVGSEHVEFVSSGKGSMANIKTFGAHQTGEKDSYKTASGFNASAIYHFAP